MTGRAASPPRRSVSGRRGAVAGDERTREVTLRHSSCKADEQSRATGGGAAGAKGGDRGKRETGWTRSGLRARKARHTAWMAYGKAARGGNPTRPRHSLYRQPPEVGTVCPNWARTDLCGGRSAMSVPTAIRNPRNQANEIILRVSILSA